MQRPSGTRIRLWWERASWVLPLLGLVAGSLLVQLVEFVDEVTYIAVGPQAAVSPEAATAVLAAIGGGMITVSGFVFSFAILIVQFGSSAYSPRMVSYFLRRRVTQWILALFLATIAYCFPYRGGFWPAEIRISGRGAARLHRSFGAPRSHQSWGGCSMIIAAATST